MTCSTCTFFVKFRTQPYTEKDGFCNRYPTQIKTLANYFCGEYIPAQTQNHTGDLESGYTKIQKALENEKHLLRVSHRLREDADETKEKLKKAQLTIKKLKQEKAKQ